MDVKAALVIDEGRVAVRVCGQPVAYLVSQMEVLGGRAVVLVGEGAEETVAVAEGVGGVQSERAELVGQLLRVLLGVRELAVADDECNSKIATSIRLEQ